MFKFYNLDSKTIKCLFLSFKSVCVSVCVCMFSLPYSFYLSSSTDVYVADVILQKTES